MTTEATQSTENRTWVERQGSRWIAVAQGAKGIAQLPGRYRRKMSAEEYARKWAEVSGGEYLGIRDRAAEQSGN